MAPRIAKGKVIIGVAGANIPSADSSPPMTPRPAQFAWQFYTVPGDPSKPFENRRMKKAAETWSGDWWKLGGGGTVGTAWPTIPMPICSTSAPATAVPGPKSCASPRARTTCMSASILAVKPDTGELEVVLPDGPRRCVGFRQRAAIAAGRCHHQGPAAQSHHAGQQERVLLCDRPRHRQVHLRPAVRASHLGQGSGRRDRPPDLNPEAHYGDETDSDLARPRRRAQLVADVFQSDHRPGLHSDFHQQHFQLRGRSGVRVKPGREHRRQARWWSAPRPFAAEAGERSAPPAIGPGRPTASAAPWSHGIP